MVCVGSAFSPAIDCQHSPLLRTAFLLFFLVRLWTKEAILSPNQKELSGHNRFQTIYNGPQGAVLTHLPHYKAIWWVIMSQNVKSVHFSSKGCTQDKVRWKNYELIADIWAIFLPFIFNFTHFMHFQGQFLTLLLSCRYLLSSFLTPPVSYSLPVPYYKRNKNAGVRKGERQDGRQSETDER